MSLHAATDASRRFCKRNTAGKFIHTTLFILTNPPYSLATEFVLHSLKLLDEGGLCIMFLKTTFLEGKNRYEKLFSKCPPVYIYQFVQRILCAKDAQFDKMREGGGSAVAYAWFVFKKGYKGDTSVRWI